MASSNPAPVLPVSTLPNLQAPTSGLTTIPAVIPTTSSTTTKSTTTSSVQSQPTPIATTALRSFVNTLVVQARDSFSQRRPWSELTDRSALSKPESLSDAAIRVRKNYSYFRINYLALLLAVIAFSLISHPGALITLLGLLAAWLVLYLFRPADQPLLILGRSFSERETLGILVVLSVFVIFLTSVGSVLISATLVGSAIVCAHGSFRVPEDLFLDEQEPTSTGFLSFLGGAAQNAAAAAATTPNVIGGSRV